MYHCILPMLVENTVSLLGKMRLQQQKVKNWYAYQSILELEKRQSNMWLKFYTNSMKHKYKVIACLVIIAYLLPYYILGEDTHIRVHDNMDSNIVWYKLLVQSGHIFSLTDVTLPNVING